MSEIATRWAWAIQDLRPAAKIVLLALARCADDAGVCSVGYSTLGRMAATDANGVSRAIRELEAADAISVRRAVAGDEPYGPNEYRLPVSPAIEAIRPSNEATSAEAAMALFRLEAAGFEFVVLPDGVYVRPPPDDPAARARIAELINAAGPLTDQIAELVRLRQPVRKAPSATTWETMVCQEIYRPILVQLKRSVILRWLNETTGGNRTDHHRRIEDDVRQAWQHIVEGADGPMLPTILGTALAALFPQATRKQRAIIRPIQAVLAYYPKAELGDCLRETIETSGSVSLVLLADVAANALVALTRG
jgi:hypothetical protein